MTVHRWAEFGEATVRRMAQARPGETLLFLADTWTNLEIADACLIAGMNARAQAQLLVIPRRADLDTRNLSRCVSGAIHGADVVLALCEGIVHTDAARRARADGTWFALTFPCGIEDYVTEGLLDVEYEGMIRVCQRICSLWETTSVCRVTSSQGTDISFRLNGRPALVGDGMTTEPGELDYFPGVDASIAPIEETINGTLVVGGTMSPGGLVREPFVCRLQNGAITAIEGGTGAAQWRSRLKAADDPKAFHMCHSTLGLNPRARISGYGLQDEHILGAAAFGFGDQDPAYGGNVGSPGFIPMSPSSLPLSS